LLDIISFQGGWKNNRRLRDRVSTHLDFENKALIQQWDWVSEGNWALSHNVLSFISPHRTLDYLLSNLSIVLLNNFKITCSWKYFPSTKLTKYYSLKVTSIEFELLEQQKPLNRTASLLLMVRLEDILDVSWCHCLRLFSEETPISLALLNYYYPLLLTE
jgi:hypothetical protein